MMKSNLRRNVRYPSFQIFSPIDLPPREPLALELGAHCLPSSNHSIVQDDDLYRKVLAEWCTEWCHTDSEDEKPSTTPFIPVQKASLSRKPKRAPYSDSEHTDTGSESEYTGTPPRRRAHLTSISALGLSADILDGSRNMISGDELAMLVRLSKIDPGRPAAKFQAQVLSRKAKRSSTDPRSRRLYHAQYECILCDEDFTSRHRMKSHYTALDPHGFIVPERLHFCDVGCRRYDGTIFETSNKSDLTRHERSKRHIINAFKAGKVSVEKVRVMLG